MEKEEIWGQFKIMPKKIIIGIVIAFVVIVLGASVWFTQRQGKELEPAKHPEPTGLKKILIVHSYHAEWGWNQDTRKGLIDGLEKNGYILDKNYELEEFFMDTKITYTTPKQTQERADEATKLIDKYKPDLVIINDDNALKYVAVPYPNESLPFLFTGINLDPEKAYPQKIGSLEKPGHNIAGVLERFPFYSSFSLAKRMFPNKTRIVLFADSSESSNFVVKIFKETYLDKVKDSPLEVIDVVQVKTYKEWQEKILEYQNKADFIGTLTYHQLKDANDKVVNAAEVVHWTIRNNRLPELGFLLFHAEDGFFCAVGVSPYKSGKYLSEAAAKILNGKEEVGNIPIVDPQLYDIGFNLKRAEMLGIKIPVDILGIATEVYKEINIRY